VRRVSFGPYRTLTVEPKRTGGVAEDEDLWREQESQQSIDNSSASVISTDDGGSATEGQETLEILVLESLEKIGRH